MSNPFTQHPHSIGQSYLRHMFNALRYSFTLIFSGILCFIHALLPFLCVKVASDNVFKLAEEFKEVKKKAEELAKQTEPSEPQV